MSVAQPLRISYIELQSAEDIEFIELISRGCRCGIRQQGKNHYREEFPEPLTVLDRSLSFSVHRKTWYSAFIPVIKVLPIDVNDVLSNSAEQKFQTVYSKLNITIGLSAGDTSVVVPDQDNSTPPDTDGPHVTTEHLLSQRPRFRILVVGRSGVGKSTLINRAFGIEEASAQDFWPGKTDIERELISPQNDRFVLHDSQGFEAGMDYNGADVQAFVVRRKMQQHIKDQLHIVWLCLTTPIEDHGDRLLDPSAETLLEKHTSVLQNIPIIVVFTKYDKLLTTMAMRKEVDPGAAAKEYLQVHCIDPIAKFAAGTNLSYVTVSSKPGQAEGYKRLIALTYEKVIETLGPQQSMPPPSVVPSMVRRPPSLDLKIESTIAEQSYVTRNC
ncbi:hypothetical protein EDC04DRAFT_1807059 [Pisolithus marmoratus]|nr:hypothetical protein EDC04DRAFT_1807059 [Pisolithus marmoratus]